MATTALSPDSALEELDRLEAGVRAAVVARSGGDTLAARPADGAAGGGLGDLCARMFSEAERADDKPVGEIEATVAGAMVIAVRLGDLMLAAVCDRTTLPSLMRYDLRDLLARVEVPGDRDGHPGAGGVRS